MSFLKSVLKAQDELGDQELRALTSENQELKGMLFGGKKSPYGGNEFASGRERMPSCLHVLPFSLPHRNRVLRSWHKHTKANSSFTERKKFLEDQCNALSSQKTAKEAESNLLKKKVDMVVEFSEKRKLTAEE